MSLPILHEPRLWRCGASGPGGQSTTNGWHHETVENSSITLQHRAGPMPYCASVAWMTSSLVLGLQFSLSAFFSTFLIAFGIWTTCMSLRQIAISRFCSGSGSQMVTGLCENVSTYLFEKYSILLGQPGWWSNKPIKMATENSKTSLERDKGRNYGLLAIHRFLQKRGSHTPHFMPSPTASHISLSAI